VIVLAQNSRLREESGFFMTTSQSDVYSLPADHTGCTKGALCTTANCTLDRLIHTCNLTGGGVLNER
jgi:hypothetical protein